MTYLNNEARELTVDELDAVSGGNLVDAVVQAAKTTAQILTDTVGKCTDHWYSA